MRFKIKKSFLFLGISYVIVSLTSLLILSLIWLPPGSTLAGHDSGLPLDSKQFLESRLYAWDDRLGFGLDNSANFGSLTIHGFDFLSSLITGMPYAGNYFSLFFWLGLIFLSTFIFAYQLKDILGKSFVFILPVITLFNFYIFQSVFMLERAKFGIFSATLIALAVFLRMHQGKTSVMVAAIISALVFSLFNGGGWFGVTLYGGVAIILVVLVSAKLFEGLMERSFKSFEKTIGFILLTLTLYILFNAYSILPYFQNFTNTDAPRILRESQGENQKEWLRYVSRSTSYLNLFRLYGVPDWYGGPEQLNGVNLAHPYASLYLNNQFLVALSFIFPVLAFASFLLARSKEQKRILGLFGVITLIEVIFAAGSNGPFGFFYEFLMDNVPGFFIFRSAFYKFGVFYMLGMTVLFAAAVSLLALRLSDFIYLRLHSNTIKNLTLIIFTFLILSGWVGYHFVLFDSQKIFSWKVDELTRVEPPKYIFEFANFVQTNNLDDKKTLLLPPANHDWQNDAYNWGYWSLSPLPYALTSVKTLSNWHGLSPEESVLVENLYRSIRDRDEASFSKLAHRLNVGSVLLRKDVLVDSNWSSAEDPQIYENSIRTFSGLKEAAKFGNWELYQLNAKPNAVFAVATVNIAPDNLVPFVNNFFGDEHAVDLSTTKVHREIQGISSNRVDVHDCLSCFLERPARLKSLPDVIVLPNSILYYFKEREEERIIREARNPNSKIADYSGLILRRTSELRRMIDLSVREEYLMESMAKIRFYLDELYVILASSKQNVDDFEMLQQLQDYLNPVERDLGDYMKSNAAKIRGPRFEDEALGILWSINRIKEFFAPINGDIDRWSSEKVYRPNFAEAGEYALFYSLETLPIDESGNVMLPKQIEFKRDGSTKILTTTQDKEGWIKLEIGFQEKGRAEIVTQFEEPPNLFNLEGSNLENFAFGNASCFRGTIKNFDKKRAYKVSVSKSDKSRLVRVIFRDDSETYSERHGFLKGEDSFEVAVLPKGEFSRHVYFPSPLVNNVSVYICSEDASPPLIDDIIVQEFFTPSLISVKKSNIGIQTPPQVTYIRINPTKYKGEVEQYKVPFMLTFNEKYNPLWKLFFLTEEGTWKSNDKHFVANGYANSWLIDQENVKEFRIEYQAQPIFYKGVVISAGAIILSVAWLIFTVAVSKRKRKNV